MSSARQRRNYRLILERAYLNPASNSNRAENEDDDQEETLRRQISSSSSSTLSLISCSSEEAPILRPTRLTVISSLVYSDSPEQTVPVTSSCPVLQHQSSSVISRQHSTHHQPPALTSSILTSSFPTRSQHAHLISDTSYANSSHGSSIPGMEHTGANHNTASSTSIANIQNISRPCQQNGNEESDHPPLFLGYPSSSLMASSLGIVDGHFDSTMPVKGEPFCQCFESGGDSENCTCGEEDKDFDWCWEERCLPSAVHLYDHNRVVKFHPDFSSGTAAVRGNKLMKDGQHYWEVKMTTHVYGTDMMIGIGTANVDLNRYHHTFCSFLGEDTDSWGISYTGHIHHNGESRMYTKKFGQGTVIGVHLDLWRGTLEYYMNRKPLGFAFTGLSGKSVYPMACSTAARSGMKIIRSCSFQSTLQLLCCQTLRRFVPCHLGVLDAITLPPGLRAFLLNNMAWLLWPKTSPLAAAAAAAASQTRKSASSPNAAESDDESVAVRNIPAKKRLKADVVTSDSDSDSVCSD